MLEVDELTVTLSNDGSGEMYTKRRKKSVAGTSLFNLIPWCEICFRFCVFWNLALFPVIPVLYLSSCYSYCSSCPFYLLARCIVFV